MFPTTQSPRSARIRPRGRCARRLRGGRRADRCSVAPAQQSRPPQTASCLAPMTARLATANGCWTGGRRRTLMGSLRVVQMINGIGHATPCNAVGAAFLEFPRAFQGLVAGLRSVSLDPESRAFPNVCFKLRHNLRQHLPIIKRQLTAEDASYHLAKKRYSIL